ncbi:hypothetical protein ANCCEY_06216 [Ancylostoma ceylanicum]|uniref:glucuronosyltransferase n=1 Tax=Ancylostoma ceylanicum TaxID=53326 RepID=A0A0D6LU05_9BILA|nr:hypothetical protein ANCCEY_06216 [Ancylostoma ceylanicum]
MKAIILNQDAFRRTLLEVFATMPEVTFIWKYEDPSSKIAESLPNVHLSAWVPQIPLLGFLPLQIPIFGDQMRNSRMLARHGGALVLEKSDLSNFEKLKSALEEVLNDPRFVTTFICRTRVV